MKRSLAPPTSPPPGLPLQPIHLTARPRTCPAPPRAHAAAHIDAYHTPLPRQLTLCLLPRPAVPAASTGRPEAHGQQERPEEEGVQARQHPVRAPKDAPRAVQRGRAAHTVSRRHCRRYRRRCHCLCVWYWATQSTLRLSSPGLPHKERERPVVSGRRGHRYTMGRQSAAVAASCTLGKNTAAAPVRQRRRWRRGTLCGVV